ncbi:MAG: MFS transporter [Candidatus Binatia bacterium]
MNWRTFYILNIAIFTAMLGMGIVIPFLPIYAKTLGATGVSIGIFFASFPLAQMVFVPWVGRLSDRWGRKFFIALGLFLSSVLSLWFVAAPDMVSLTLARFFQGCGAALILPISAACVGDIAPPAKRGELMGIFNLFLTGSIGIGPLAGGWISETYGMATSFYCMGALNALAFLFVVGFLSETHSGPGSTVQQGSYRLLLQRPLVRGIALYRMVNAIQLGLWFSFLPILATELLQLNKAEIGPVLATYMLTSCATQVPFGRMADRLSKRRLIMVSGVLSSAIFLSVLFVQGFWPLLLVNCLAGFAGAISTPALTALAAQEGQGGSMGAVMGILSLAMSVGMMLGPVLAGLISDFVGLRPLFVFGAIAGILGTLVFAWLTGETRRTA